jgi:sec-independent protein translocase protein TatA
MPQVGPLELIVVLIIALIVLGPKRLPDVARSVGKGVREFREAVASASSDDEKDEVEEIEEADEPEALEEEDEESLPRRT